MIIPILIVVYILIFILEGRPILYNSPRYISSKKKVTIYKFRTMVKDPTLPEFKLNSYLVDGFYQIPLESKVYTNIGRFLEKTQIVELLQLVNVLCGQMSLVGNRPLPQKNHEDIAKFQNWEQRYLCPCGITGISQIVGKDILKASERIKLESMYALCYEKQKFSLILIDFYILYRTFIFVFFKINLSYSKAKKLLEKCLKLHLVLF